LNFTGCTALLSVHPVYHTCIASRDDRHRNISTNGVRMRTSAGELGGTRDLVRFSRGKAVPNVVNSWSGLSHDGGASYEAFGR
jgi:hypothetical protein